MENSGVKLRSEDQRKQAHHDTPASTYVPHLPMGGEIAKSAVYCGFKT